MEGEEEEAQGRRRGRAALRPSRHGAHACVAVVVVVVL